MPKLVMQFFSLNHFFLYMKHLIIKIKVKKTMESDMINIFKTALLKTVIHDIH